MTKVMFLVATARPRYESDGDITFDGKIGLRPFSDFVSAKRSSKNRKKGTMEIKPSTVNRAVYKKMLIENVISAIMAN